jgi:hypothetical protein
MGEKMGLAVWVEDEAGPYQTVPYPGESWQPESHLVQQPHEYIRNGTAKMLTLFHPVTGEVHVKGVTQSTNAILHPWIKEQLSEILKELPEKPVLDEEENHQVWKAWQEGLSRRITLSEQLPPLRMLLIWDNLQGHYTPEMVLWLFAHGIMPLYTPLSGSWLNMAESIQRILIRRSIVGWKRWLGGGTMILPRLYGAAHEQLAVTEVASVDMLWVVQELALAVRSVLDKT